MFSVLIDGKYHPSDNLPPSSNNKKTIERRERRKRSKSMDKYCIDPECRGCDVERSPELVKAMEFATKTFELAPLPKAVPCMSIQECVDKYVPQQEGKTPMRYNDNYASASVSTVSVKSDAASQREYFSDRLQSAFYPKQKELEKLFNLYVNNTPTTFKQLIDAIKNDKFKIDPKTAKQLELVEEDDGYFYGPLYGIIFDGPQRDPKGFGLAYEEMKKQKTTAQDIIVAGDAAAGLKALQDFEAWLPSGAAS